MNKIGIITWYWGNYGSILQAYALQQYLIEQGYDCEIINHHVNGDLLTQLKYRLSHDGLIAAFIVVKRKMSSRLWGLIEKENREKRAYKFDAFIKNNMILSSKHYTNHDYNNCLDYDIYVCGSDQIWNPSFTFFSPFYWLSYLPDDKLRISYAPSMGTIHIKDRDKQIIRDNLLKFRSISIREKNSGEILEGLDDRIKVKHVSDPTILLDDNFWRQKIKKRKNKENYLFAYLIKGNDEQREYITKVAKDNNLKLVVYPYLENHAITSCERTWGDCRCFDEDPFDFLTKIYYANIVITDSFHCSVFSILFHKEFYALKKCDDKTNQFNRITQLLSACKVGNRIITEKTPFARIAVNAIDSDTAIAALRSESRRFLNDALLQ